MINIATSEEFWDSHEILQELYDNGSRVSVSDKIVFKMWENLNPKGTQTTDSANLYFNEKINELKTRFLTPQGGGNKHQTL